MGTALITTTNAERDPDILRRVEQYLWASFKATSTDDGRVLITGTEFAGFTFAALRERLFSGLIATEIVEYDGGC